MFTKELQCFRRLYFHNHYGLSTEKSLKWRMTREVLVSKFSNTLLLWYCRQMSNQLTDFKPFTPGSCCTNVAWAYLINRVPITLLHMVSDVIQGVKGRQFCRCWRFLPSQSFGHLVVRISATVCCIEVVFQFLEKKKIPSSSSNCKKGGVLWYTKINVSRERGIS
jgi:hypothetical protein